MSTQQIVLASVIMTGSIYMGFKYYKSMQVDSKGVCKAMSQKCVDQRHPGDIKKYCKRGTRSYKLDANRKYQGIGGGGWRQNGAVCTITGKNTSSGKSFTMTTQQASECLKGNCM